MNKFFALTQIHKSLANSQKPLLNALLFEELSSTKRKRALLLLGKYTLLQTEIEFHQQVLHDAYLACQHGLTGTQPEGWEEDGHEEAYDAYRHIVTALERGPGRRVPLSPTLLEYIEQLPHHSSDQFLETFRFVHQVAPSISPQALEDLPDGEDEGARLAHLVFVETLQKTLFILSYEDDLAQAIALAKSRERFKKIQQVIGCY